MAYNKPFEQIVKEIRERKQFERESAKQCAEAKCSHCGSNLTAIGRSKIPSVCNICVSLSMLPDKD